MGVALPRARAARDEFTDVELRIIALVRQGMTNRQIAAAVQVSEKTVENHLTRLFAKTGCRSRLDLATASLEGRLTVVANVRDSWV
jgi:DNA-binding NarL/FixJ family response regulator